MTKRPQAITPRTPVFAPREQIARQRGKRWADAKRVIVAAMRPAWLGLPPEQRTQVQAVAIAFRANSAYWMYEPAPLGLPRLGELCNAGCPGVNFLPGELGEACRTLWNSGRLVRMPWLKPTVSSPNFWQWVERPDEMEQAPRPVTASLIEWEPQTALARARA